MVNLKCYEKCSILLSKNNSNNTFLNKVKYNEVIEEVKRLKHLNQN